MRFKIVKQEEIITLEDGFKYFWPLPSRGAFSAENLRDIAEQLDEMNKDWQVQLELDLSV